MDDELDDECRCCCCTGECRTDPRDELDALLATGLPEGDYVPE